MSRLVEAGWVGPAEAGPTRRRALPMIIAAVVLAAAWAATRRLELVPRGAQNFMDQKDKEKEKEEGGPVGTA